MVLIYYLLINYIINLFYLKTSYINQKDQTFEIFTMLQQDFINLGVSLSLNFTIQIFLISLSTIISLLIYVYFYKKININKIENIAYSLLNLFFINSGVFISVLYLFRAFNLNRFFIFIFIIINVLTLFSFSIFLKTNKFFKKTNRVRNFYFNTFIIFSLLSVIYFNNFELDIDEVNQKSTPLDITLNKEVTIYSDNCPTWKGSSNFVSCLGFAEVNLISNFSKNLNNVISFKNDIYILDTFGTIFKNDNTNVFLQINEKINNRIDGYGSETGLISLAFHPSEPFFLVSYTDVEMNLIVEKYMLSTESYPDMSSGEILIKIPGTSEYHIGGNIIWSDYFKDFLISVGDMEMNVIPLLNTEPFDTTSPRGKILFLNHEISNSKLISATNLYNSRKDILAYGLRNPWKTYEYENYLFVPDIGWFSQEELNIVDLNSFAINSNTPFLFGWPYFEGSIDNEIKYNDVLLWEDNKSKNINDYIYENSIEPEIFYSHESPTTYRAAIIGGEVISDTESSYFEHYFFADYLSKELFAYDFKNKELFQIPLKNFNDYISSIIVNPLESNSIIIASGNGDLFKITLPEK